MDEHGRHLSNEEPHEILDEYKPEDLPRPESVRFLDLYSLDLSYIGYYILDHKAEREMSQKRTNLAMMSVTV